MSNKYIIPMQQDRYISFSILMFIYSRRKIKLRNIVWTKMIEQRIRKENWGYYPIIKRTLHGDKKFQEVKSFSNSK